MRSLEVELGDTVEFADGRIYVVGNIEQIGSGETRKSVRLDMKFEPSIRVIIRKRR